MAETPDRTRLETGPELLRLGNIPDLQDPAPHLKAQLLRLRDGSAQGAASGTSCGWALGEGFTGREMPPSGFMDEGDVIVLLGSALDSTDPWLGLGSSTYLQVAHGKATGDRPFYDAERLATLRTVMKGLINSRLLQSARECAESGLAACLAQCCISRPSGGETTATIGANVNVTGLQPGPGPGPRLDALLFGETPGRVVVSCKPLDAVKVIERSRIFGLPAARLGTVGGEALILKTAIGEFSIGLAALLS